MTLATDDCHVKFRARCGWVTSPAPEQKQNFLWRVVQVNFEPSTRNQRIPDEPLRPAVPATTSNLTAMNWTAKRLRTRLKFGGRVLPLPLWLVCAWLLVLALSLAARFVFGFERNALLLQMEEDAGEDSASSDEAIEAPSNNTTIHHSLELSTFSLCIQPLTAHNSLEPPPPPTPTP
ncbi:hypothetical protein BC830DRAFT_1174354 [Chytriomyces sp. MP71]|nr:hypothetical protein BC830DRAFT_1174354 [Chytriomyces sp. MP71]